jgi:hypothetical protein
MKEHLMAVNRVRPVSRASRLPRQVRRGSAAGWARSGIYLWAAMCASGATLPGTAPLQWNEPDLSARLMDGAHAFVERKIAEAPAKRSTLWTPDFSSVEAYEKSIAPNRERLRTIIGAVDARLDPLMERYGDDAAPALVAETKRFQVHQVRWAVLEGVWGAGLLVSPVAAPTAHLVWLPDADQTPEQVLRLEP